MVEYFSVTLALRHDRARLQLRGELDMAATNELSARVDEACAAQPSLILFDISELTYCDSSGIRVLLETEARCTKDTIEMRVVGTQPNVRRVFEMTGTVQ